MDGCNHILTAAASSSKLSSSDGTLFHDETFPREFHWAAVKRILRYIQSISSHGLFFARQNTKLLHSYSDVNWGGSLDYRKSTTDFAIFLGSHLISSASKKQRAVARSSTEAEYRALANTASELT
ncbi:secreted RxLR effector protein 161-like [Solanum lycopersicum]|uniref:secreted RxLR effector protein 161-like n=1 Tax=Solanum lycopersicum TaxID=4081 RepID=UPI003748DF2A